MERVPVSRLLKRFRVVLAFSILTHVVIIALFMAMSHGHSPSFESEDVLITKLVRLGKKRPEHLLPRLQKPKPPAPKSKKSDSAPKPSKAAVEKVRPTPKIPVKSPISTKKHAKQSSKQPVKTMSALERLKKEAHLGNALDRLRNKTRSASGQEPEGDPKGSVAGTVSDVRLAIVGNRYASEVVVPCIRRGFVVEGVGRLSQAGRSATVWLRIDRSGRVDRYRIEKASGSEAVDRAVDRAVQECRFLSAPPPEIRRQLARDGIEVLFKP
ncbi:MAG: TonB family protein [Myxococcota bacterium]|nr:TonB family protein [Myxococcota bacterium]